MKLRTIFYVIIIQSVLFACTMNKNNHSEDADPENTQTVNGLLYLDGEPVSIEIDNGKIAAILLHYN